METRAELAGQFARLPDGQKVKIESIEGSRAVVRRIGGERHGSLATCDVAKLEPLDQS
jgi:hypothetical protein